MITGLKIRDIMVANPVTIGPDALIVEAAKLMRDNKVGSVIVVEKRKVLGIVTERDFVRRVVANNLPSDIGISKIMSKPLITIEPDSSLREAARLMLKKKNRKLPIVVEKKISGNNRRFRFCTSTKLKEHH